VVEIGRDIDKSWYVDMSGRNDEISINHGVWI